MSIYSLFVVGVSLSLQEFKRKKTREKKPLVSKNMAIPQTKAKPEVYKGISFVRISNLPEGQGQLISETEIQKIKIKTDATILTDCVQYHHYEKWFESFEKNKPLNNLNLTQPTELVLEKTESGPKLKDYFVTPATTSPAACEDVY